MLVIPAIDLRGGRCVRLVQGDYDRQTVFDDDPPAVAARWEAEGAEWLHVVDLDGAKAGCPMQLERLAAIRSRVRIPIEFGGGLRTIEDARRAVAAGADRLILGTVAIESPEVLEGVCREFPGRVYVAVDVRWGKVAVRGWTQSSGRDVFAAARECEARGAAGFLFTDIARDGTGAGVNVEAVAALADRVSVPVLASGGVASLQDVRRLRSVERRGVAGVIVGRALYTGAVRLRDAIAVAAGSESEALQPPTRG